MTQANRRFLAALVATLALVVALPLVGHSGSPVINARGELVGLIFDGNIQSLPGSFVYDGSVNRAVSVDARGMLDALKVVYKADAIVKELAASAASASR